MVTLIADCETSGFLNAPNLRLWCIQLGSAEGDDAEVYTDEPGWGLPTIAQALERIASADTIVFHNGLGFDMDAINRSHPGTVSRSKMIDTLVAARLAQPQERDHRLKAWGVRTNTAKGEYKGDFQKFDQELLDYARQDIVTGRALYHAVKHVLDWGNSYQVEHEAAWRCIQLERNGWQFDIELAQQLEVELRGEQEALAAELQSTFPPIERSLIFVPKVNNKTRGYVKGVEFVKRWMEPFNPASRAHVAERLQLLGWKPKTFGDDGIPTVDEKTLTGLPYPQVKPLLRSFRLGKQLGMLTDGKSGWLKLVKSDTGRIHHRVNPNGAVTARMSHSGPNLAQADKKDIRMRRCFKARPGWVMFGCDAEGAQLRMLGHYLARWDGGELSERLVNGDKKIGTDAHTVNLKALHRAGLMVLPTGYTPEMVKEGRDGSKAIVYALLFGAGDFKLGESVKAACRDAGIAPPRIPSKECGLLVRKALAQSMVGSDKLVDAIKAKVAQNGYLIGLDGRRLPIRSEHSALNTLLQAGEAVVMKQAIGDFGDWLDARYVPDVDYGLCGFIHDEIQGECRPELADELGQAFADCITQAGVKLGVRCALAGSPSKGPTWADTH